MMGNRGGADCWWVWLLYRYRSSVGGAGGYRKCEGRNIVGSLPSSSSLTADWRFHLVLRGKKGCMVTMETRYNVKRSVTHCLKLHQLLIMLNH